MGKINLKWMLAALVFTPFISFAQTATSSKCVQREDQMVDVPKIKGFVAKIGGIQNLEGDWKLGGFAGKFKRVIISFESASDGLKALIEGLETDGESKWGNIAVCDTVRADTLQVKVIKTKDALYMRQGSMGSLELAQIQNGKVGTFYSFYRN